MRVPIIDASKCRPDKCRFECGLRCPVNQQGKQCIEIVDIEDLGSKKRIAKVNEALCTGCGQCANPKRGCPFGAIQMVNIPIECSEPLHAYQPNGFRLYGVPVLKKNHITGLLGPNGIGKSTLIALLDGSLTPNLGRNGTTTNDLRRRFAKGETFTLMDKRIKNTLRVTTKKQTFEKKEGYVGDYASCFSDRGFEELSGGERQYVECLHTIEQDADLYIFDEPMNFLDVGRRLEVAHRIRSLAERDVMVLVIEHDIIMLEYMADTVHVVYGVPGAFGSISKSLNTSHAINQYFEGYLMNENMRIRPETIDLVMPKQMDDAVVTEEKPYEGKFVEKGAFKLHIQDGSLPLLSVVLGKNGTGKTTFVSYLAHFFQQSVSAKTQNLKPMLTRPKMTVKETLYTFIPDKMSDPMWCSIVLNPLDITRMFDLRVKHLSGGECQRLCIMLCLGREADLFLLDEPSSYLDIEQRARLSRLLVRFALTYKKHLLVVEHDLMIAAALGAEKISKAITLQNHQASSSQPFEEAMTYLLSAENMTFREGGFGRPRLNKLGSQRSQLQQRTGQLYVPT